MAERVKPKRSYHSPRRQAQAAATRRSILEAAQRLFERQGYAATTMDAIAEDAGVALKTVYVAFATKSGVLRGLWDLLLKGDLDERRGGRAAVVSRGPRRGRPPPPTATERAQLTRRQGADRRGPGDDSQRRSHRPDIDALWNLIQTDFYDNQRTIVQTLHRKKALRPGLDVTRATDILWTLNHPDMWQLLVGRRAWTPEQYEKWFADTACSQLLKPAPTKK